MRELAELIEAAWSGWSGPVVEEAVAGTRDPLALAELVDAWVGRELGARARRALWYHASVGMVAGLELGDGRCVVVKAYQPRFSEEFLGAVVRTQRWLAGNWYPCARPLAGPAPLTAGLGLATAETMVDDPGVSTDRDLVASAAGLAWLVRYTDRLDRSDLAPHPLGAVAGDRYPVPHSPLFDFERDTTGVAWIDELADVALAARAGDRWRPVIGHTDWSARNVRWDRRGVQAVFDLDSVAAVPDSFIAGQAAVTWATTMDVGEAPLPDPARIGEFLDVYHLIREEPIKGPQIRAAWGSALWVLCYTARCEHAMDRSGAAVERLRRHGDELAQRASDGGSAGSV